MINFTITALPPAPNSGSPANFNALSDAWCQALPTFGDQLNSLIALINNETANLSGTTGVANPYDFVTGTGDVDPGTGKLALGNATQNLATVIRLSRYDTSANDLLNWINTWDDSTNTIKGYLRIAKAGDPTKFLILKLTSLASTSTYFNVSVTPVESSSPSPFAGDDHLIVSFLPAGDAGLVWQGGSIANRAYTTPQSPTVGATTTVDASLSNVFYISLTQNITLSITNPADGQSINIRLAQDATGGRTVTLPAVVNAAGALDPGPNKINWLNLTYVAASAKWEGAFMSL